MSPNSLATESSRDCGIFTEAKIRSIFVVILFFIETFTRSFGGMLRYIFNPLKRNLYKGRVKGMLMGFLKGLKS